MSAKETIWGHFHRQEITRPPVTYRTVYSNVTTQDLRESPLKDENLTVYAISLRDKRKQSYRLDIEKPAESNHGLETRPNLKLISADNLTSVTEIEDQLHGLISTATKLIRIAETFGPVDWNIDATNGNVARATMYINHDVKYATTPLKTKDEIADLVDALITYGLDPTGLSFAYVNGLTREQLTPFNFPNSTWKYLAYDSLSGQQITIPKH